MTKPMLHAIEDLLDVTLQPPKMKPRGQMFSTENNPQHARWRCVECHLESSVSGILKHQRFSGHVGKQRQDV